MFCFEVELFGLGMLSRGTIPADSWQSKWLVVFGEGCLINSLLGRSGAVGEGRISSLETLTDIA